MPNKPPQPEPHRDPFTPDVPGVPEAPPIPDLLTRPVERPVPPKKREGTTGQMLGAAKAWSVAMEFVFTILAGLILGYFADKWWSSAPKAALGGLALAFVIALWRIIQRTKADERAEQAARERDRAPRGPE